MCAIVGSFQLDKLKELIKLNSYRGSHSYAISFYDIENGTLNNVIKDFGKLDVDTIRIPYGDYCIAHIQAPTTTKKDKDSIHPATVDDCYLWHNGIIKEMTIEKFSKEYNTKWDTKLLLEGIKKVGYNILNEMDGTFSCLMYKDKNLLLFRNEISPMFIDDDFNISSTKFDNSRETDPNKVIQMDLKNKSLQTVDRFKTYFNPYYFGD
jgi:glucosamine 6-phosphate synthetase-like amidotransferase/phosphosugar isomerase protein